MRAGGVFAPDPANLDALVYILDDDHWIVTLQEAGAAGNPRTIIAEQTETITDLTLSRTHEVMTPVRPGDKSLSDSRGVCVCRQGQEQRLHDDSQGCETSGWHDRGYGASGGDGGFHDSGRKRRRDNPTEGGRTTPISSFCLNCSISPLPMLHMAVRSTRSGWRNRVEIDIQDNDKPKLQKVKVCGRESILHGSGVHRGRVPIH